MLPFLVPVDLPVLPAAIVQVLEEGNDLDVLSGPTGLPAGVGLREQLGTLVLPNGERVRLTASDLIWTARMLDGESSEAEGHQHEKAALLWTIAQRRYWGSADGQNPASSFNGMGWTSYLKAFSQPINPRWAAGGEFCGPGGRYASQTGPGQPCSAVALERRRRITGKRWDQLTAESRQIALDFATGNLPNLLPGAVNWAGRNVSSGLPRVATPSDWNNYFYFSSPGSTGGSRRWAGANIVVEQAAGESLVAALVPGAQGLIDRLLGGN